MTIVLIFASGFAESLPLAAPARNAPKCVAMSVLLPIFPFLSSILFTLCFAAFKLGCQPLPLYPDRVAIAIIVLEFFFFSSNSQLFRHILVFNFCFTNFLRVQFSQPFH